MFWFVIGIAVNVVSFFAHAERLPPAGAEAQGELFATVVVMPAIPAVLLALFPRFRNMDAFAKIYCVMSVVLLLVAVAGMLGPAR